MKPHIDPKVDCVFKALLGAEGHVSLLRHFLNAVLLPETGARIDKVEILNPYNEREFESDKLSVVDIKARDERGRSYQIEIQLLLHPSLTSRMLYTWSAIYHGLLSKGKDFTELRPVISIWLLNETLFARPGAHHLPFVAWNCEHQLVLSEDFRIHVLQLPEWQMQDHISGELDRWMYLFTQGEDVDVDAPPTILQTDEMKEAIHMLRHFSENERDYLLYQKRLDSMRVEATWLGEIERTRIRAEKAEKTAEEAKRQEKEAKRQEKEAKRHEKEAERNAKKARMRAEEAEGKAEEAKRKEEEAKMRAEEAQKREERYLRMLKQAGIDPNG